jgi:hypothetical protein
MATINMETKDDCIEKIINSYKSYPDCIKDGVFF